MAGTIIPFQQQNKILVNDGDGNKGFYEGLTPPDTIPWSSWTEPLILWGIFFLALYVCMVCVAVILRRQWTERERLSYPLTQVRWMLLRKKILILW